MYCTSTFRASNRGHGPRPHPLLGHPNQGRVGVSKQGLIDDFHKIALTQGYIYVKINDIYIMNFIAHLIE